MKIYEAFGAILITIFFIIISWICFVLILLKKVIMAIQAAHSNVRLFPAQVGSFYVKRKIDKYHYDYEGPYKIGTVGQADLNGVVLINGVGVRLEVEIKSGKVGIKKNSDQDQWRVFCQNFGIIHIEAKTPSQAVDELGKKIEYFKTQMEKEVQK